MNIELIIKYFIMGIVLSAPIGPTAIISIKRTLEKGFMSGMVSGLAAMCVDTIYALATTIGITWLSELLYNWLIPLRILGIIIILSIVYSTFRQLNNVDDKQVSINKSYFTDFTSIFIFRFTNPVTLLVYATIFVALKDPVYAVNQDIILSIIMFSLGCFSWWLTLNIFTHIFKKKLNLQILRIFRLIIAVVLSIIAVVIFIDTIVNYL